MSQVINVKNDRREIFGWLMYDWANSAFYTTVISVLLGPYIIDLAQKSVGENGVIFGFGALGSITAKNIFSISITISVLFQILLLPILGGVADYTNLKKRLMMFFCYVGVISSCLLFFVTDGGHLWGSLLLIIGNLCFGAANVFYNAYLVDITTEDKRDSVSSYGFALGYVGGLIMLIINLAVVQNAEALGLTTGSAVRISFLAASVWWGVFALVTFKLLKPRGAPKSLPENKNVISVSFSELGNTFKQLGKLRQTAMFLVAYFCFNNGIQTIINSASIFLAQELFVAKGLIADNTFLLGIFIVAQVFALVGALAFERLARVFGTKNTLLLSLVIWTGIVIYAYAFLETTTQAWIMAAFIGIVLGSSQALSRSLYSQMIPEGREASFFGLYEISERGTALLGSLVFGIVVGITGSFRQAIFSMIVFFILGVLILYFTDIKKAIHQAGNKTAEELKDEG